MNTERILIFTGKGGVGKSSVAAAHALKSAKEGKKTLLVSTDMAHNLADIFETAIGRAAVSAAENLDVLEIDPNDVMEHSFPDVQRAFMNILNPVGLKGPLMESLNFIPGMEELFSLLKILEIYEGGTYERMIVDCAPTGETLSLLKFPELIAWYMEKFFPVGKVAMRVLSPISKRMFKVELPDVDAMNDIERMYVKLAQLTGLLKNRQVTSIRIVCIPEKMVVEETKRNYMYMNLYDFLVDGLYINRILPKDMENEFFNQWIWLQQNYIGELEEIFKEMPIYRIPWFDSDLNGIAGIGKIQDQVLDRPDIFAIGQDIEGEHYEKTETGYLLRLRLPCVNKADINLHESETDIIIKIGNFKRNIPKPNTLRRYTIGGAKMAEEMLLITFYEREHADGAR